MLSLRDKRLWFGLSFCEATLAVIGAVSISVSLGIMDYFYGYLPYILGLLSVGILAIIAASNSHGGGALLSLYGFSLILHFVFLVSGFLYYIIEYRNPRNLFLVCSFSMVSRQYLSLLVNANHDA